MLIGEHLANATLARLPAPFWPKYALIFRTAAKRSGPRRSARSTLTDSIATEAARLRKIGVKHPFVHTDLRRWVPEWAPLSKDACDDREGEAPVSRDIRELAQQIAPKREDRKAVLNLAQWHAAWSRYSVAAAATDQLTLAQSFAHRDVCMHVALKAQTHKRRHQLAIFYDEAARKLWAERSRSGDEDFDIAKVTCRIDVEALTVAEQLYDREEAASKAAPKAVAHSCHCPRAPPSAQATGSDAARDTRGEGKSKGKGKWLDSQKPTQPYWYGGTGGWGPNGSGGSNGSTGWGHRDAKKDTRTPVSPKRRKTSH